jgi:hypothetical protein
MGLVPVANEVLADNVLEQSQHCTGSNGGDLSVPIACDPRDKGQSLGQDRRSAKMGQNVFPYPWDGQQ